MAKPRTNCDVPLLQRICNEVATNDGLQLAIIFVYIVPVTQAAAQLGRIWVLLFVAVFLILLNHIINRFDNNDADGV